MSCRLSIDVFFDCPCYLTGKRQLAQGAQRPEALPGRMRETLIGEECVP